MIWNYKNEYRNEMIQTILSVLGISVIIAIPSSMIALGLKAGRPYLKELFGKPKLLTKYFLVMFILMPALALAFYFIDPGHQQVWIAVLVISISPASPGLIKGITKLGGDSGLSTAWMITAIFLSFIMIPVNLLIIEQLLNIDVKIGIGAVIIKLLVMFIIPILIGFRICKYRPNYVSFLSEILENISKIATIVLVICLLIIAVPMIIQRGIIDFSLILLFIIVSLAITHFIESSDKMHRPMLSYSVILRLPAPAVVLAGINGMTEVFAPEILSFVITGTIVMAAYKKLFYRKENPDLIPST